MDILCINELIRFLISKLSYVGEEMSQSIVFPPCVLRLSEVHDCFEVLPKRDVTDCCDVAQGSLLPTKCFLWKLIFLSNEIFEVSEPTE